MSRLRPFAERDGARDVGAKRGAQRVRRLLLHVQAQGVGAPFAKAVLVDVHHLQARERRDACRRRRIDRHLVAELDLAQELVRAGRAVGRALLQALNRHLALQLVARIGVARQHVGIEGPSVNEP